MIAPLKFNLRKFAVVVLLAMLGIGPLVTMLPQHAAATSDASWGPLSPTSVGTLPDYATTAWTSPANIERKDSAYASASGSGSMLCPDGWPGNCYYDNFNVVDANDVNYIYLYKISGSTPPLQPGRWHILSFRVHALIASPTAWYVGVYAGDGSGVSGKMGPFTTSGIGYSSFNVQSYGINMNGATTDGAFWIGFTRNITMTPAYGVGLTPFGGISVCGTALPLSGGWSSDWPGEITPSCGYNMQPDSLDSIQVYADYVPTDYLFATNYGFPIPTNAVIDGISVNITRYAKYDRSGMDNNYVQDTLVALDNSGQQCGSNAGLLGTNWDATPADVLYGSSTNRWDCPLTPTIVDSTGFGVIFAAAIISNNPYGDAGYIDWIGVTVYYTIGTTTQTASTTTYTTTTGVITQDQTVVNSTASFSFPHAANVLVTDSVVADLLDGGSSPTAVSIGGAPMTLLATATYSGVIETKLWYLFRSPSGPETITLTGGSIYYSAVVSETGTATAEPFFEGTNTTVLGDSNAASVNVAAGTAGRRVFGAIGTLTSIPVTLYSSSDFTTIISVQWSGSTYTNWNLIQYKDTASAASPNGYYFDALKGDWAIIGTAILPGTVIVTSTTYSYNTTRTLTPGSCTWPELHGSVHSADDSSIVWQGGIVQQGPSPANVGCIGQRQVTSTAPIGDNTRVFIYMASDGSIYAITNLYAGKGGAGILVAHSYDRDPAMGAVISDLVQANGYAWGVVAYESYADDGIVFIVLKISEAADQNSWPTITVVMSYFQGWGSSSEHSKSIISDVQLFQNNIAYASFSYQNETAWDTELMVLDSVWSASPSTAVYDYHFGWSVPIGFHFSYAPNSNKIIGVLAPIWMQEDDVTKYWTAYDFSTLATQYGHSPGSPSVIFSGSPSTPAGFASIVYDSLTNSFVIAAWEGNAEIEIATLSYTAGGWGWAKTMYLDPLSSDNLNDCLELHLTDNAWGLVMLVGLFNDGYLHYIYSFQGGIAGTWFGSAHGSTVGRDWFYATSGYIDELPMTFSMPTYMQPSNFSPTVLGYGTIMELDDGWWIMRTFQYLPPVMTMAGAHTTTYIGILSTTSSDILTLKTTVPGTTTVSTEYTQTVVHDVPITLFIYPMMVIFSMFGAALAIERSVLSVCCGLSIGVTLAIALNLVPAYTIAVVLLLAVAALFFSR